MIIKNKLLCLLLCLAVCFAAVSPAAAQSSHTYTVAEVQNLCDGIVGYKDGKNAQHFINNGLCENAGISAEFYVIALSQQGNYDFSSYESALLQYLQNNEIYSATSREKYALALIAAGSDNAYISQVADEAIGGLGLMSLVFGLHLLNNGCQSKLYSTDGLVNAILREQLSDGGWAVIGERGDVDVTAMVLQSLAPYYRSNGNVKTTVNKALTLLSNKQQSDGGFIGMGVENCESTAQVVTALSDLGFDANSDSRFVKNGNSALDGMLSFRNSNGSFCHLAGKGFNETATMEAFYALTAYMRHLKGQGPLYVLDHRYQKAQEKSEKPKDSSQSAQNTPKKQSGNSPQKQSDRSQDAPQYNDQNNYEQSGDDTPQNNDNNGGYVERGNAQPQQYNYINNHSDQKNPGATEKKAQPSTQTATSTEKATQSTDAPTEGPTVRDAGRGAGLFQSTDTATEPAEIEEEPPTEKGSYKPYAIGGILAAAILAAVILYLLKKRNKKHFIAVGILAAAGILFILLTNFESTESYHTVEEKTDTVGTVTISVRCDTLAQDEKPEYIPEDCIILDDTTFAVAEGDTVYDILMEASRRCDFQVDNRGAAGNAYIAGIEYLYEFDYGDLSGWMYKVDGEFPDVGCQSYALHGGETIEWLYTKNIGKDL